jgi:hypothetical protein
LETVRVTLGLLMEVMVQERCSLANRFRCDIRHGSRPPA